MKVQHKIKGISKYKYYFVRKVFFVPSITTLNFLTIPVRKPLKVGKNLSYDVLYLHNKGKRRSVIYTDIVMNLCRKLHTCLALVLNTCELMDFSRSRDFSIVWLCAMLRAAEYHFLI